MSFKDKMIEAVEQGLTTEENAYDYVRESMADAADAARKTDHSPHYSDTCRCRNCNTVRAQEPPVFIVGDRVVWDDGDEQGAFNGMVTRADFGSPVVMVKLDVGGTFSARRADLKRL